MVGWRCFDRRLTVQGIAAAHTAGTGADRYSAPPGAHLVVATVSAVRVDPGLPINPQDDTFKAVLRFDGTTSDLALDAATFTGPVTMSFAVAVPDSAPQAILDVSEFGLTQSFDLITGRRAGPDYSALYRSTDATSVTARSQPQGAVLKADFLPTETDQLTAVVSLGGFSVLPPTPVSDPASGALTVQILGPIAGGGDGPFELDASKVNVTVAAPTPGPAPVARSSNQVVSFTVPATTTSVNITIGPDGLTDGSQFNVAPITFHVTLPPPATPSHAATVGNPSAALAAATLTVPTASTVSVAAHRLPAVAIIAAVLVLAVIAIVVNARRRRPAPAVNPAAWDAVLRPTTVAVPYIPSAPAEPDPRPSPDPTPPTAAKTPPDAYPGPEVAPPAVADPTPEEGIVKVLGPIDVEGLLSPTDRPVVIELLVFLAFHRDRPQSGEVVRAALRPPDEQGEGAEQAAESLQTYASRLRRAVGADRLPNAKDIGGYQLVRGVTTDIELFTQRLALADAEPANARRHLRAAIDLVRGEPFESCGSAYNWAWTENWVSNADKAVTMAAHRLCALALGANDLAEAWWAAETGLRGSPRAFTLHQDHLDASADAAQHRVAWEQAVRALGAAEASRLQPRRD